jgi:hypothetical protein
MAPLVTVDGTLTARGGVPSSISLGDVASQGRIRVEAVVRQLTGATIQPTPTVATAFGQPVLQTARPTLRVTSVIDQAGTQMVQNPPTASFAIPDVTINDSAPVTVNIEATNVPVGTVVQLHLLPETGPGQVVASTPLAGTTQASSATVSVTILAGFSRGFVRAVFAPSAP